MKRRLFTLVEAMVAIGVILGLALAAGVYISRTVHSCPVAGRTRSRIHVLEVAIVAYHATYDILPFTSAAGAAGDLLIDDVSTPSFKDLLDTLSGNDVAKNPRQIPYLAALDADGQYRDSWETSAARSGFVVVLDLDYDNRIADAKIAGADDLAGQIVVWSHGPDRRSEADLSAGDNGPLNRDNINSW